jgi:hypothetical protein
MSVRELTKRLNAVARRMEAQGDEAEDWADLQNRVPAELWPALAEALADPDRRDSLDAWLLWPFATWARMPDGFVFPRELVAWILDPPRDWFLGHACEACGLAVPLYMIRANDHDPPPSILAFPQCPACGGGPASRDAYIARRSGTRVECNPTARRNLSKRNTSRRATCDVRRTWLCTTVASCTRWLSLHK